MHKFPYKITSGKALRISFSDKSVQYRQKYNTKTDQYESYKEYMTQKDIDEYKQWFYDLWTEHLGMEM